MIGQRLSQFEVTAKLGEGGMGEVYRAEDTKLGREVAIKVLPEAVAGDAERLARFEREAKVLASLNHPNIAGIHQVEEDDGVHFLVMELAHGKDLAERTTSGPLSIDEALGVAQQIALALEAAHEKGIVHRDLKPANIMVTDEGQVKVLDFGLAKALETGPGIGGQADLSLSPTLTAQMTQAGVILGTAAYMSPEQARGEEIDKRSDIWAFGVLLYELLTGQKTYSGKTVTDVIAAVVTKEPDWDALPPKTPSQIQRLLARCAQKEPHERLHDIADARIAIQEAIDHPEFQGSEAPLARTNWLGLAAGAVAGLILGALLWSWLAPTTTTDMTPQLTRAAIEIPADQEILKARISRDGRLVAYIARPRQVGDSGEGVRRLYLRPMEASEARVVADTDHVQWATFSPDGRWIAYYTDDGQEERGKIKKIAVDGGPSITLLDETGQLWGSEAYWQEDGRLLVDHLGALAALPADGGEPEILLSAEAFPREVILGIRSVPRIDTVFLTIGYVVEGGLRARTEILSLASGEKRLLVDDFWLWYVGDDFLFGGKHDGYVAAPFDLEHLEVTGSMTPLFSKDFDLTLSDNGTLLSLWNGPESRLPVVVDREGTIVDLPGLASAFDDYAAVTNIRLSPDGKRFAMSIFDSDYRLQLYTYDVDRGALARLGFPDQLIGSVAWSPDGERIAFSANSDQTGERLYIRSAAGNDTPQLLLEAATELSDEPSDWSLDGSMILFNRHNGEDSDVLLLDIASGEVKLFVATSAFEHSAVFSPDGGWVALESNEPGQREVYVVQYPAVAADGNPRRFRASANGGQHPKWAPDGKTLYFVTSDEVLTAVTVEESDDGEQLSFSNARAVFNLAAMSMYSADFQAYDLHPDGTRFALLENLKNSGDSTNLQVVFNWFQELEQKLERPE